MRHPRASSIGTIWLMPSWRSIHHRQASAPSFRLPMSTISSTWRMKPPSASCGWRSLGDFLLACNACKSTAEVPPRCFVPSGCTAVAEGRREQLIDSVVLQRIAHIAAILQEFPAGKQALNQTAMHAHARAASAAQRLVAGRSLASHTPSQSSRDSVQRRFGVGDATQTLCSVGHHDHQHAERSLVTD